MRYRITILVLLIAAICILPGCMTYDSYVKIDEQVKRIQVLEAQAREKVIQAKSGEMSVPEMLAWIKQSQVEITAAKDELNKIKGSKNVGWVELFGAIAASMLGGTGLVRAWRGPTHKNAKFIT